MLIAKAVLTTSVVITSLVLTLNPQSAMTQSPKASPVVGSAAIPGTPAGRQLTDWLKAFNSGDDKSLRAFHAASGAGERLERRTRQDFSLYKQTRGLEVKQIEASKDDEIIAVVQAKLTESWYRVTIRVSSETPHNVTGLSVRVTSNPAPAPRGTLSEPAMVKALSAYMDKLVRADAFSGAVLVARNGNPVFERAYGFANTAYKVPNRVDTKFNLGSMNKMFTAVAICQLAEQGKLSFNDLIGKHLSGYANKTAAQKVTIHHLLTHTSGIGDYFNEKFMEASRDRFRKIQDYFPLFAEKPLEFEPGAKFQYSNAGFMVLGAIVEKVSGQDYFVYVREQIYARAGMINTDAYELDRDTPNLAFGYTSAEDGARRNNLFLHVIKGGPAGGGYSTVQDLLRFDVALRQNKLLSGPSVELLLSGKVATTFSPTAKYAYGFFDDVTNGQRIVGHGGGFPGINSQLDMYLNSGYTVSVMANYDPPAAQIVANKLRELVLQL